MANNQPGKTVFIGNIPYGLTEEQIVQILSSAGQVNNFRLVYDSDTGRPKGFGFAEFLDVDSAASAVRNLNGHEIMGRQLRVDFSHVGGKEDNAQQSEQQQMQQPMPPSQNGYNAAVLPSQANGLPPLPPGVDLQPNITCPDAISKTLSTLPPAQLLDILSQLKGLVMQDPAKATELLSKAPQLSYAIFQALLIMGLIEPQVLAGVIEQAQPSAPQIPPPQQNPQSRPTPVSYGQPPPPQHQQQYPGYPPPPQHMQPPMGLVPTPPVPGGMYQPPPQQIPPSQSSNEELLKQLLSLPQHEIDRLRPEERQQVMELKQRLGGRF